MALAQIKLIVDVTVLSGGSTALLKYATGPDEQAGWFIPNDQLVEPEDPYDAAQRLLRDQIGLEEAEIRLVDVESFTGRDKSWHLALHFAARVAPGTALAPGDGVAELRWFPTDALPPPTDIAHHGWYRGVIARAAA